MLGMRELNLWFSSGVFHINCSCLVLMIGFSKLLVDFHHGVFRTFSPNKRVFSFSFLHLKPHITRNLRSRCFRVTASAWGARSRCRLPEAPWGDEEAEPKKMIQITICYFHKNFFYKIISLFFLRPTNQPRNSKRSAASQQLMLCGRIQIGAELRKGRHLRRQRLSFRGARVRRRKHCRKGGVRWRKGVCYIFLCCLNVSFWRSFLIFWGGVFCVFLLFSAAVSHLFGVVFDSMDVASILGADILYMFMIFVCFLVGCFCMLKLFCWLLIGRKHLKSTVAPWNHSKANKTGELSEKQKT